MKSIIFLAFLLSLAACSTTSPSSVKGAGHPLQHKSNASSAISTPMPIWQEVYRRYTPQAVFRMVMKLAEKPWIAPTEIEQTFGIHFKPPVEGKGVGLIYDVEGGTRGSDIKLFFDEPKKEWALFLDGMSPDTLRECVYYNDAVRIISEAGWSPFMGPTTYEYVKKVGGTRSRLFLVSTDRSNVGGCIRYMALSNP